MTIELNLNNLSKDNNLEEILQNVELVDTPTGQVRRGIFWLTESLARELHFDFWGEILVEEHYFNKTSDWCPRDSVWIKKTVNSHKLELSKLTFYRNKEQIPWRQVDNPKLNSTLINP